MNLCLGPLSGDRVCGGEPQTLGEAELSWVTSLLWVSEQKRMLRGLWRVREKDKLLWFSLGLGLRSQALVLKVLAG